MNIEIIWLINIATKIIEEPHLNLAFKLTTPKIQNKKVKK